MPQTDYNKAREYADGITSSANYYHSLILKAFLAGCEYKEKQLTNNSKYTESDLNIYNL